MNIQRSSSARWDIGNPGGYETENDVKGCLKKVYRKMKTLETWRKMKTLETWRKFVLAACVVALAIDPLFLFIPEIISKKTCFSFDKNLGKTVCVLRTFIDTFYVIHILYSFITDVIVSLDPSQKTLRSVLAKAVVVLSLINVRSSTRVLVPKSKLISFTKWIIVCQYIPRIIRIHPLYKQVTKTSATIAESNWIGATLNLFIFMLFSYMFGAFWYVSAIDKQSKCWHEVCATARTSGCDSKYLFCQVVDNSRFLNTSCPLINPDEITHSSKVFNFGMLIDALKSGVVDAKPRDFPRKFMYCFWWGLRNLSTFATNLKPGDSATDIFFAVIICVSGLFLFAVLFGNVQKYMITTTMRVEEMKERQRDTEKWMCCRALPDKLQKRIRKYDKYKWRKFRGAEEDALLHSLPKDLRLETKRHLYKNLLKQVPLLGVMNEWQLEAVCDRVKSVFYSADSYIVREGEPVEEMLIVTKGQLECKTKSGDHYETSKLKEGGVCGDLHFWIFNPNPSPHPPTSNKTVKTLSNVEGFILSLDDLNFVASQLDQVQTVKVNKMFRSLSSEQRRSECSSSSDPQNQPIPRFQKMKHSV